MGNILREYLEDAIQGALEWIEYSDQEAYDKFKTSLTNDPIFTEIAPLAAFEVLCNTLKERGDK